MKKNTRTRHTIGTGLKITGLIIYIFSIVVMSFLEIPITKILGVPDGVLDLQMVSFGIGCMIWGLGVLVDPETRVSRVNEEAGRGLAVLLGICLILFGILIIVLFVFFLR